LIPELKKEKAGAFSLSVSLEAQKEDVEKALNALSSIKGVNYIGNLNSAPRFLCSIFSVDEAIKSINGLAKEKGWILTELSVKEPSLEEVFLGLFKRTGK
jgi:hypothetical protein